MGVGACPIPTCVSFSLALSNVVMSVKVSGRMSAPSLSDLSGERGREDFLCKYGLEHIKEMLGKHCVLLSCRGKTQPPFSCVVVRAREGGGAKVTLEMTLCFVLPLLGYKTSGGGD